MVLKCVTINKPVLFHVEIKILINGTQNKAHVKNNLTSRINHRIMGIEIMNDKVGTFYCHTPYT